MMPGVSPLAATGAKYGYGLIWFLVLLGPIAYIIQEMTVRLGAVTKRGHTEAIFDAFGPFWGWFSFIDLTIVNWLTLKENPVYPGKTGGKNSQFRHVEFLKIFP